MPEPLWLDVELVLGLHDYVLEQTGGASGVRDRGLLESALSRPINRYLYEGVEDICELAATYAHAVSGNHPFVDGNKRAAFVALGQFLEDNGWRLQATDDDATVTMLALAAGELDLPDLVTWVRANSRQT